VWGEIKVVGVSGPLADAARARLTFEPGDPYSTKAAAASQQAIYGIGRFKSVRIDVDRSELATVANVKVSLEESTRWEARGGLGAGLDTLTYQAHLLGRLTHAGWPTPLTTLSAEFRPAYTVLRDNCDVFEVWNCDYEPRIRLLGTATQKDLFRPEIEGEIQGGLDYLTLEAYTQQGARLSVGLSSPLGKSKRIQARLGYLLAGYDFTGVNSLIGPTTAARLGLDHFERLGAFTQAIAFDFRDNSISPRIGAYAEIRLAEGGTFAGGAYQYLQIMPELRGYLPIGKIAVLAAHARVGLLLDDVPPTERFYGGGAASQRGFAERRLSPTVDGFDSNGNPTSVVIGGGGLFETGVELRTRFSLIGIPMGSVIFLDGGDVTEDAYDLDPTDLHWAVGAGLRFFFLPFPIRLEAAYRLNRTGPGEPQAGDHFNYLLSVGEAF
jgi:outer membrane translocation and assembly module TamA